MLRNAELLDAVQPQPGWVETLTDPLLLPPTAEADIGLIEYVQDEAPKG